jgi:hypothetical protein
MVCPQTNRLSGAISKIQVFSGMASEKAAKSPIFL